MSFARTYDSARPEAGIAARLGMILRYPTLIWQNRYTVQNFFQRELRGRFHGSFLGAWWMLVQPLFMFAVYFVVFGMLFDRGGDGPEGMKGYAVYLFSGVIVFHALVEASSACCNVIVTNGNLVKKVAFPSEVLPIHISMVSVVIYLVGAVVAVAAGMLLGVIELGPNLLALPLVIAVQFVFVLGLGLLLANANVFVRDVQQVWRIFTTAWMFLSPVFWYPSQLAEKLEMLGEWAPVVFAANPAFPLIMAQRYALAGEHPDYAITDFWQNLGVAACWAAGLFVVGFVTFVGNKHKHADIV